MKIFKLPICLTFVATLLSLNVLAQNNAFVFDGVDDAVTIAEDPSLDITGDLTLECMFYPTTDAGSQVLVMKTDGGNTADISYALRYNAGILRFGIGNGTTTNTVTYVNPALNEWHHVAGVHDSSAGTLTLYLDRTVNNTTSTSFTTINNSNSGIALGHFPGFCQYFNGQLDEVRIWNRRRNEAEITAYSNGQLIGNDFGLAAYYSMENISASSIIDGSTNSNNATIGGTVDQPYTAASSIQLSDAEDVNVVYDTQFQALKFNSINSGVSNSGLSTGHYVLFEDIVQIDGSNIDAIVRTINLSSVQTFTDYDYSGSGSNTDYFAPRFDFNDPGQGGGFAQFEIEFIANGTCSAGSGTPVTQHVLDVNKMSQGMYHLMVRYKNGGIWSEKVLIKQCA